MNANHFVAVGRIERLIRTSKGLTLVIGGTGPIKGLVAVELRDPALVKLVSNSATGFLAGDLVSVSGRLELDVETMQNVAVALPDSVSRIARGAPARAGTPPVATATSGSTKLASNAPMCPDETLAAAAQVTGAGHPYRDQGLVCLEDIEL